MKEKPDKPNLHIYISKQLKKELQKEAKENEMTLNGYIRFLLLNRRN